MINVKALHDIILLCAFEYVNLSDHPLVKHTKTRNQSREFRSYLKRTQVVRQSLGVDVQFSDGRVLLEGAPMDFIQVKCFIKARQGQTFTGELSGEPLNHVYMQYVKQSNNSYPDSFAWMKLADLKSVCSSVPVAFDPEPSKYYRQHKCR